MKASCIGAAGMTSGFGPSDQECLLALPKVNFSPPNHIVLCINPFLIHAFASPAEMEGGKREKKTNTKNWQKIQKKNYALKRISVDERSKGKGQAAAQESLGYLESKRVAFLFSRDFTLQGSNVCKRCDRLIDRTSGHPLRSLSRHDLPGNFWFY